MPFLHDFWKNCRLSVKIIIIIDHLIYKSSGKVSLLSDLLIFLTHGHTYDMEGVLIYFLWDKRKHSLVRGTTVTIWFSKARHVRREPDEVRQQVEGSTDGKKRQGRPRNPRWNFSSFPSFVTSYSKLESDPQWRGHRLFFPAIPSSTSFFIPRRYILNDISRSSVRLPRT